MITDDSLFVGSILNGQRWVPDEPLPDARHEAIVRAAAACSPVSVTAVARQLLREGMLDHVGGLPYLAELARIPETNKREAYDRGYADGREARRGKLVRVYSPEENPYDEGDGYSDLELAYCDGWNAAAKDAIREKLKDASPDEVLEAVLQQSVERDD
jgi:hypothetical protein